MKIEQLTIYGFGQHQQKTLHFPSSFSLVFGKNEAGKTTIQQFILQILFGFPPKNHDKRYEPKNGGAFGGKLTMIHPTYGKVIIERVANTKSAGDVTITYENGTIGTEVDLKDMLSYDDQSSYEAIYAFSVFQLQQLDRMKEEELMRTLFASGTTGIDELLTIEKVIQKEKGQLFKKGGRNPEINQQIEVVKQAEQSVRKAQEKISAYEPLQQQLEQANNRLQRLIQSERDLQVEKKALFLQKQLQPIQYKLQRINEELTMAAEVTEDEIESMEHTLSYESKWHTLQTEISRNQQREKEVQLLVNENRQLLHIVSEEDELRCKTTNVSIHREQEHEQFLIEERKLQEDIRFYSQKIEKLEQEIEERERFLETLKHSRKSNSKKPSKSKQFILFSSAIMAILLFIAGVFTTTKPLFYVSFLILFIDVMLLLFGKESTKEEQSEKKHALREIEFKAEELEQAYSHMQQLEKKRTSLLAGWNENWQQEGWPLFSSVEAMMKSIQSIRQYNQYTAELEQLHNTLQQQITQKGQIEQRIQQFISTPIHEEASLFPTLRNRYLALKENFTKRKNLIEEKEQLLQQMKSLEHTGISLPTVEKEEDEIEQELSQLGNEKDERMSEIARLEQQIQSLMEDESYHDVFQRFEQEKAKLQQLANRYVAHVMVETAIQQQYERLKSERLPAVIAKAGNYFSELTNGVYATIQLSEQGLFIAQTKDQQRFNISELSQATKEQAYLALRFALAVYFKETTNIAYPLVLDDPFVHFDDERKVAVIRLLQRLSQTHQILWFTCHETFVALAKEQSEATIVPLEIERSVIS